MCSAKRFSLIARALEVLFLSSEIEFERVGEAPSDRRRHPLLESTKRKKYLFCRAKRGRHFVDQINTNRVPDARNSALDRRLSTQMHFRNLDMRSRSTPGDPNAFLIRSNALALDACRPKCISGLREIRQTSAPVDPNAFPEC